MSDRARRVFFKALRVVGLGLGIPFVLLAVMTMAFGDRFIFFPTRYPEGDWAAREHARIPVDEVEFTISDGTRLVAWHARAPNERCTFLYFHGNAGNIADRLEILEALAEIGVSTFAVDYRGYGKSGGTPTGPGILADAEGAWAHLTLRLGVPPNRVVLFGKSLGGACAIDLAYRVPARGLIVQSAFTSIADVASRVVPLFPAKLFLRENMNSVMKIGAAKGATLIVHSKHDEIVPFEHGVKLFAAAPEPKWFAQYEGVGHNELISMRRAEWLKDLSDFLDRIGLPRNKTP
jgi:fermentation-respiration switch protein FrsA (DUF1100 family)